MTATRSRFLFRFLVLLLIALVPLGVFVAMTPPPSAQFDGIAWRTAKELDRLLQLRAQQVFTTAAFPSIRAFASSTPETRSERAAVALNELQAWVAADTNVREAFITDAQGIVIMATREGWNSDASARTFVREALTGQIAISPIARDRDEYSTYYAAPIFNNSQEIAGALVIRVAAQEVWEVTGEPTDAGAIVLVDENGVRLEDTGEPALRLASLGTMGTERATDILNAQWYGAQLPVLRATQLERAQDLVEQGKGDELSAADLNAGYLAAKKLASKPWYVLVTAPAMPPTEVVGRYVVPVAVAVVLALCGAVLLARV